MLTGNAKTCKAESSKGLWRRLSPHWFSAENRWRWEASSIILFDFFSFKCEFESFSVFLVSDPTVVVDNYFSLWVLTSVYPYHIFVLASFVCICVNASEGWQPVMACVNELLILSYPLLRFTKVRFCVWGDVAKHIWVERVWLLNDSRVWVAKFKQKLRFGLLFFARRRR